MVVYFGDCYFALSFGLRKYSNEFSALRDIQGNGIFRILFGKHIVGLPIKKLIAIFGDGNETYGISIEIHTCPGQ